MIDFSVYNTMLMQILGLLSRNTGQWGPYCSLKRPILLANAEAEAEENKHHGRKYKTLY